MIEYVQWDVKRRRPPNATEIAEEYDNQRASRSWQVSSSAKPKQRIYKKIHIKYDVLPVQTIPITRNMTPTIARPK